MVPVSAVADHVVPPPEPYCTDHPARFSAFGPGLKISMKSLVNTDPLLPPPPYTWLITADPGSTAGAAQPVTEARFCGPLGDVITKSAALSLVSAPGVGV